jgi:hypothetical protein
MTSAMVKATRAPIAVKLMKNHIMRRFMKVGFAISLFIYDLKEGLTSLIIKGVEDYL